MKNNVKINSKLKAGGVSINHNQIVVKTAVRSGGVSLNHNQR